MHDRVRELLSNLSPKDRELLIGGILEYLEQQPNIESLPVSIFSNELPTLQAVVKYLKEHCGQNYTEIATLLNRNQGTIGVTYRNAKVSMPQALHTQAQLHIPLSIFKDRTRGPLQTLVKYLHDNEELTFKEISKLLHRNYQTIITSYK